MIFPSGGDVFYTNFKYHLGSAYIIAYLREKGINAEQFISNESYNVTECVKKILSYKPKIIGFSVYETNYMQCVLISNGLKSYNSDIIIVFGGPTPTVQSIEVLESIKSVDLCVRQEGEETLLELIYAFSKNNFKLNQTELLDINGITFRNKNKIITNPDSNVLFSNRSTKYFIDKYPSPYISQIIPTSKVFPTGLITARGCNQNCIYCNCAVLSKKNIYFHSKERVIEELLYIYNKQTKFIAPIPIYDDTFTMIRKRTEMICEAIIENDIKLPLQCITRCDKITKELLDLLKQAGFQSIGFSLESANPRVLRAIGKVNPTEIEYSKTFGKEIDFINKFKDMTSYAKKIGMKRVFVSIMVGLPGESLKDAQKTIQLINKSKIDVYTHNYLCIYRGTPIFQNYKKYGYSVKPIGQNYNNVILRNNFPFDVLKIKLGKKCSKIPDSKVIDYDTLKFLSLTTSRINQKPYFDKVIVNSDTIKPSLIKWLQDNLMINGAIIHIFSNKGAYLKLHEGNKAILYDYFSPTLYYVCYYWESKNEVSILKPGRMAFYGDHVGLTIKLRSTSSVLKEFKKRFKNVQYQICQDRVVEDSNALYDLLVEILKSKDSFDYLLKRKPLPQFQELCRWTNTKANCQQMETAIIDDDGSIRICWHSIPLGKIGSSFADIKQNLQKMKKEIEEKRNCLGCIRNKTCVKCLFPFPMSSEEYCKHEIFCDTTKAADLIDSFNTIKDYLLKPINLFDF